MQTFLPVADFTESARLLDNPRLGKQRVECLQVLRALELPDYGWANHPVVTMWRGRTAGLVVYSLAMVRVWRERGFADTTETLIAEFAPDAAAMTLVVTTHRGMYRSEDGGHSWTFKEGNLPVHLESGPLVRDPSDARTLYAVYSLMPYAEVWRTALEGGNLLARATPAQKAPPRRREK